MNFELGNYAEAAKYARASLELTEKASSDDEAATRKKKTLLTRLAKSQLHDCQLGDARQLIDQLGDAELETSLRATIDAVDAWKSSASLKAARNLVFDRLPRFKPYLIDVPEYYAIGHDIANGLYDEDLEKTASAKDDLAFLFCGSGDGRHVFMTLLAMGTRELMQKKKTCRKLHITLLDLKPAAIARTLIFFDMMMFYALMKGEKVPGIEDAPTVMAYLYLGHVIPKNVNVKLNQTIERLLVAIDSDKEIFDFFLHGCGHTKTGLACLEAMATAHDRGVLSATSQTRSQDETGQREDAAYHVVRRGKRCQRSTLASLPSGKLGRISPSFPHPRNSLHAGIQPPFHS